MGNHENEFNEVKIVNEDSVDNFEFGSTPKADSASFEENKNKIRDEVNDNPVSNSDVKDEEKKEQKKKEDNSSKNNKSSNGSRGSSMASSVAVAAAASMVVVGSLSALIGLSPIEPGPAPEPTPTPSNICTITFDPGEGSGTMESVQVKKGSKYETPESTFELPDWWYYFRGWKISSIDAEFVPSGFTVTINEDSVFTALFLEHETNMVSFDPNGGTGYMEPIKVIHLESVTLPECEFIAPEGQEFSHWEFIDNPGSEFQPGDQWGVFSDNVFAAQWKDIDDSGNNP